MTVDGKHISDADRIRLMLEIEHEVLDESLLPLIATAPAQKVNEIVSATPAALDDDSNWPAARFAELVKRLHELDQDEVAV